MRKMSKLKIIREITPKEMDCILASCPAIFKTNKESYVLIGKKIEAEEIGISKRVGKDEIAIEIPKNLIDKMK